MQAYTLMFYAIIIVFIWLVIVSTILAHKYIKDRVEQKEKKLKAEICAAQDALLDEADEQRKEEFKNKILKHLLSEMEIHKQDISKEILELALRVEDFKLEQMRKNIILETAVEVFYEFKKKFFNNVKRVIVQNNKQRKGNKEKNSKYQEEAIKEAEEKMYKLEEEKQIAERQKLKDEATKSETEKIKEAIEKAQKQIEEEALRKEELRRLEEQERQEKQKQNDQQNAQEQQTKQTSTNNQNSSGGR